MKLFQALKPLHLLLSFFGLLSINFQSYLVQSELSPIPFMERGDLIYKTVIGYLICLNSNQFFQATAKFPWTIDRFVVTIHYLILVFTSFVTWISNYIAQKSYRRVIIKFNEVNQIISVNYRWIKKVTIIWLAIIIGHSFSQLSYDILFSFHSWTSILNVSVGVMFMIVCNILLETQMIIYGWVLIVNFKALNTRVENIISTNFQDVLEIKIFFIAYCEIFEQMRFIFNAPWFICSIAFVVKLILVFYCAVSRFHLCSHLWTFRSTSLIGVFFLIICYRKLYYEVSILSLELRR